MGPKSPSMSLSSMRCKSLGSEKSPICFMLFASLICLQSSKFSDPQVQKDFVQALYDGSPFLKSLPSSLSDNGILVTQVGSDPHLLAPSEDHSIHKNRVKFFETLVEIGFGSVRNYSEVRRSHPVNPFRILEYLTSRT